MPVRLAGVGADGAAVGQRGPAPDLGILRPEVTEPLGTEWSVCAWDMGLELLAMLILKNHL